MSISLLPRYVVVARIQVLKDILSDNPTNEEAKLLLKEYEELLPLSLEDGRWSVRHENAPVGS